MPPRGIIESLQAHIRAELDGKLRANNYSELVALSAWLEREHGVTVSKSALGRYSSDLKAKDRASEIVARDMRDNLTGRETIDLLVELGTLRIREHRILRRLEEIGYIDLGRPIPSEVKSMPKQGQIGA